MPDETRNLLLRCTPGDVGGCRLSVTVCGRGLCRSVPGAPYAWNVGTGYRQMAGRGDQGSSWLDGCRERSA